MLLLGNFLPGLQIPAFDPIPGFVTSRLLVIVDFISLGRLARGVTPLARYCLGRPKILASCPNK